MKKIALEFEFKQHRYEAVVRIKPGKTGREYHVTILDWQLERLLYGNEVISETNGAIEANVCPENAEQSELKITIATRLAKHLGMPCFAGNQCIATNPIAAGWEGLHPIPRHNTPPAR